MGWLVWEGLLLLVEVVGWEWEGLLLLVGVAGWDQ